MTLYNEIKASSYHDSVTLMVLSSELDIEKGVINASVMMGTDRNKEILKESNLLKKESESIGPNDLIIAAEVEDEEIIPKIKEIIEESLQTKRKTSSISERSIKSIEDALDKDNETNLVLISTPGVYATLEAERALISGLNVFMFSDNVPIADEIRLKNMALERNLLMMGPDCGTAILNGVALGFANVVRKGTIGIIGASGTGIQEITSIVHNLGEGISQAIGIGGRDLSAEIDGKMMLYSIDQLLSDEKTEVIVLISKPPAKEVAEKIYNKIRNSEKPFVICFLGEESTQKNIQDIYFTDTLTDTSIKAVNLINGNRSNKENNQSLFKKKGELFSIPKDKYIRGLFSGGTLCHEALILMNKKKINIHSNLITTGNYALKNLEKSKEHTFIDMGEDYFTEDAPHPMIDLTKRLKRMKLEAEDPDVAVILFDLVLGYGSHMNPAEDIAKTIAAIQNDLRHKNRTISFVASVCGTEADPQIRSFQEEQLENVGVHVYPTNSQAVEAISSVLRE